MLNKLLDFYANCLKMGFVKILYSKNSEGLVTIYAPNKVDYLHSVKLYDLSNDKINLYDSIKTNCWISQLLSKNNYNAINKFKTKLEKKYSEDDLEYEICKKGKKYIKIIGKVNSKKIRTLKLKLFSINLS